MGKIQKRYELKYFDNKTKVSGTILIEDNKKVDISDIDYLTTKLGNKDKVLNLANEIIDLDNTVLYIEYEQNGKQQLPVIYDIHLLNVLADDMRQLRANHNEKDKTSKIKEKFLNKDSVKKIRSQFLKNINNGTYIRGILESKNFSTYFKKSAKEYLGLDIRIDNTSGYSRLLLKEDQNGFKKDLLSQLNDYRRLREILVFESDLNKKKEYNSNDVMKTLKEVESERIPSNIMIDPDLYYESNQQEQEEGIALQEVETLYLDGVKYEDEFNLSGNTEYALGNKQEELVKEIKK